MTLCDRVRRFLRRSAAERLADSGPDNVSAAKGHNDLSAKPPAARRERRSSPSKDHNDGRASTILKKVAGVSSWVFSVISITIAVSVYVDTHRVGEVQVLPPTRYGLLGGKQHNNAHDKILLSFALNNDGNIFRHVRWVRLTLEDEEKRCFEFVAVGQFDRLGDQMKIEGSVLSEKDFGYSLFSSLPLAKNEFHLLNLLFFFEQSCRETSPVDHFSFVPRMKYRGQLHLEVLQARGKERQFHSPAFAFEVLGHVTDDWIVTFSNVAPVGSRGR